MKKVIMRTSLALCACSCFEPVFAVPANLFTPQKQNYVTTPTDASANQVVKHIYTYLIGRRGASGSTNKMVEGQHLGGINDILQFGALDYEVHGIVNTSSTTVYPGFVGARYDAKQKFDEYGQPQTPEEVLDPELDKIINYSLIDVWNTYHPIIQLTASPRNPWDQALGRLAYVYDEDDLPDHGRPTGFYQRKLRNLVRTATGLDSVQEQARTNFWIEMQYIADGLKQLSDAGVPIILRPFAEWNTGTATKYWGESQDGALDFIPLWNDIYAFYTGTGTVGGITNQNLHNLLFCWEVWVLNRGGVNAYISATEGIAAFYPGKDKVDIVGGSFYFKPEDDYFDANENFSWEESDPQDKDIYEYLISQERPFGASQYGLNTDALDQNGDPEPGDHDFTLKFMDYVSMSEANPMAFAYYWDDPQQVERQDNATAFVSNDKVATANDLPYTVVSFLSVAAHDGWLREGPNESSEVATYEEHAAVTFRTGDVGTTNKQCTAIVSFNSGPSIPDNATVAAATLSLKRSALVGDHPFDSHGELRADIKGGGFGSALTLAYEDFNEAGAPAGATNVVIGGMSKPAADNDWSNGFINAAGLAKVNKTVGHTQLRVYFESDDDNDGVDDYIEWFSGDATLDSKKPVLIVTYLVP